MNSYYIGSYAPLGKSSLFEVQLVNDHFTIVSENVEAENPSYLYCHPNGEVLYAVEECVPNGRVAAFRKENGCWRLVDRVSAGSAPCHLEMDSCCKHLFASNYMDGSISVYEVDQNGLHLMLITCIQHTGHGVDPIRQEGPHMHSCLCLDDLLYAADLGLDTVFVYNNQCLSQEKRPLCKIQFPDGCGVRHMAIHPKFPNLLYVNAEMGGKVFVVDRLNGKILQTLPAVENPAGKFSTSAVKIANDLLCVATRGCNQLALYRVLETGLLQLLSIMPLRDDFPRDLYFDGKFVMLANQGDKSLSCFSVNSSYGLDDIAYLSLKPASPSCIIPGK